MDAHYDFTICDIATEEEVSELTTAIQEAILRVTGERVNIYPYIES